MPKQLSSLTTRPTVPRTKKEPPSPRPFLFVYHHSSSPPGACFMTHGISPPRGHVPCLLPGPVDNTATTPPSFSTFPTVIIIVSIRQVMRTLPCSCSRAKCMQQITSPITTTPLRSLAGQRGCAPRGVEARRCAFLRFSAASMAAPRRRRGPGAGRPPLCDYVAAGQLERLTRNATRSCCSLDRLLRSGTAAGTPAASRQTCNKHWTQIPDTSVPGRHQFGAGPPGAGSLALWRGLDRDL